MLWSDKLKLKKGLVSSLTEAGYAVPKEMQLKTMARIIGGQDVIGIGPDGCGKTATYILAALNRFTYLPDGVPQVLVLVPGQDSVLAVIEHFNQLNKNKTISIVGLYAAPGIETQMNALADGADIVVATPDRARALYLKLGLNLNKVSLLVIDDAELIVKQGLQLPVAELANSIPKCQHLVFTAVMHDKLAKMIAPFMKQPATIEVEQDADIVPVATYPQVLYHVPNFGTKLNLLRLFAQDEELFTKAVVVVNTRQTAEKIYTTLQNRHNHAVAILKPWFYEWDGFDTVAAFNSSAATTLLIAVDEHLEDGSLQGIPFLIHFELPLSIAAYTARVTNPMPDTAQDVLAITFATDLELDTVKKIEQTTGQKMQTADLPDDLLIEKDKNSGDRIAKAVVKSAEPAAGGAFHEKKASNAKTYNFSSGEKAKMNKKKKH